MQNRQILDGICLEVERGDTLILLGRSGSGKTTALRLINRMLDPSTGKIFLAGQDISQTDPIELRRKTGYVIQDFGLLPHWTVERNVALGATLARLAAGEAATTRVGTAGTGRAESGNRFAPSTSTFGRPAAARGGGARARLEPGLLLFDEPFGALDPVTRHEMQQQFLALRARYNVASVFVTHDLLEALAIGTRIAVLDRGKLECLVSPAEFFDVEPRSRVPSLKHFRPLYLSRGGHA